jgi:hypothetical protein
MKKNKTNYNLKAQKALQEIQAKREKEESVKKNQFNNTMLESANRTFSRNKGRKRVLATIREENEYYTNIFNEAMVEILSDVVEQSLLLDEDYAELNPSYKLDIKDILESVLREGAVNEDIENDNTVAICEAVYSSTPLFESKEEKDSKSVAKSAKDKADKDIDALVKDTKGKVLDTLSAEKKKVEELNKELEDTLKNESTKIFKENKDISLLEMFALNDAKSQINENGDYSSELALSNGILMITIMESLKASGLVDVDASRIDSIKQMLKS